MAIMKPFIYLAAYMLMAACNSGNSSTEAQKAVDYKENMLNRVGKLSQKEQYTQMTFKGVEDEMFTSFIFLDSIKQLEFFLISSSKEEQLLKKLLEPDRNYSFIFEDYDNSNVADSLNKAGYAGDDFAPSGKYINYLEDEHGRLIYSSSEFAGRLFKNMDYANNISSRFKQFSETVKQGADWPNYEFDFDIIDTDTRPRKFLVSKSFGSGSVQETYWRIENDTLYPTYIFEFGGMPGNTYSYHLESLKDPLDGGNSVESGEITLKYLQEGVGWEEQWESKELKSRFIKARTGWEEQWESEELRRSYSKDK
jgi:hypothetical protein